MDVPATRGALRFRNAFTGNPMADYLLGYVSDLQLSNVWVVQQRHSAQMFFVQDDWKANSRLSVNLGLRYDYMTPATEAANAQTNFDPSGAGALVFASDGSLEERALVQPDRNNFAPRLGVVYRLDDKTTVRGGWGLFYNLFDRVGSEDQLALNLPGLVNKTITQTSGSPVFLLQQGFPAGFLNPPNLDPAAGQLKAVRVRAVNQDDPSTTISQASAGLQRELPRHDGALGGLRLLARLEPGDAGQPESAAPECGRQQRARPAAVPQLRLHRVEGHERQVGLQGPGPRRGEALRARLRLRCRLHARQVAGQRLRAADHPGIECVPAERAGLRPVVRPERLRRPPSLQRQLRVGAAARHQRLRARLDGVGHLHRAHRPSLHRQPERQQRRHEHDRAAERRSATPTARKPSISGSTRRHSRRCRRARSATSSATG